MGAASVDNYKLSFEKYTEGWRQVHILKKKLQQNFVKSRGEEHICGQDTGEGAIGEDTETTRKSRPRE